MSNYSSVVETIFCYMGSSVVLLYHGFIWMLVFALTFSSGCFSPVLARAFTLLLVCVSKSFPLELYYLSSQY